MATTSPSLLLHPQLYSFARAYMWQLLRQGSFAEKATEPLHALAQELAQAIAATSGDREQKNRLLSTVGQYLAGGDLSVPPPGEIHALMRPLLPGGAAPESLPPAESQAPAPAAPAAPAPAAPVTPEQQAPAAAATPAAPVGREAAATPEAVTAAAASTAAASAPTAESPPPSSAAATSEPVTVSAEQPKADLAAVSTQDTTVEFVVQNPADAPASTAVDPAVASGLPPEAVTVLPPHDLGDGDGAPGVSTDVKPKGNKKNRKS